jgi:hypothetical protein
MTARARGYGTFLCMRWADGIAAGGNRCAAQGCHVSEGASYLFAVATPMGFSVRTTADYWSLLEAKHPKLHGRAQDVAQVLSHPDLVYESRQDRAVFLCYRADQHRLLCAVVKRIDGEGFLITAYPCDKIKEGDQIWPTSESSTTRSAKP